MQPRILIADDDPLARKTLSRFLGDNGFITFEAEDGPAALRVLYDERPDAVILDRFMPGMTGDRVLEIMQSNGSIATIPVIMVSANRDITRPDVPFLPKPYPFLNLLQALEDAIYGSCPAA